MAGVGGFSAESSLSGIETRWQRRLARHDRMSQQEREITVLLEREDALASSALSKLTGHPVHECRAAFDLFFQEPETALTRVAKELLTGSLVGAESKLREYEKALVDYERWVARMAETPVAVDIANREFAEREIYQALRDSGARIYEEPLRGEPRYFDEIPEGRSVGLQDLSIEGDYSLTSTIPECSLRFLDYATSSRSPGRALLEWARELAALPPSMRASVVARFSELVMVAEGVFDKAPNLVNFFIARGTFISRAPFGESTIPAITTTRPLVDDLKRLIAVGAGELLGALGSQEGLQEALGILLPRLERLKGLPQLQMKDVVTLLRGCSATDRYDTLDAILDYPSVYEVARMLKRHAKIGDVALIQKLAQLLRDDPEDGAAVVQRIQELAREEGHRLGLAHVVSADIGILRNVAKRDRVLGLVAAHPKCHLILPAYLEALRADDEKTLTVLESAARVFPKGDQLMGFLDRLALLCADEQLAMLESAGGDIAAYVQLVAKMRPKKGQATHAAPRMAGRNDKLDLPWHEQIFVAFERGTLLNRALLSRADVEKSHERLTSEYSARLRSMWERAPQVVSEFCADVLAFSAQPWFEAIIHDSCLFAQYRTRLSRDPLDVRRAFDRFSEEGAATSVSEVRDWLFDRAEDALPVELRPVVEITTSRVPKHIAIRPYQRVVIWGHFHTAERRNRLHSAAGNVPLVLRDSFGRRMSERDSVQPGDLVLCLTKAMTHKLFYGIKSDAMAKGATLVCTVHEGTSILEEILTQIAAAKAASVVHRLSPESHDHAEFEK